MLHLVKSGSVLTKSVDKADTKHVEAQKRVINRCSTFMVHEEMVEDRTNGGRQTSQIMHNTNPPLIHFRPRDTHRQKQQKTDEGDT